MHDSMVLHNVDVAAVTFCKSVRGIEVTNSERRIAPVEGLLIFWSSLFLDFGGVLGRTGALREVPFLYGHS